MTRPQRNSSTEWSDFFKKNPLFGLINSAKSTETSNSTTQLTREKDILRQQKLWKSLMGKASCAQSGKKNIPNQAKLPVNLKKDNEVKEILKTAARNNLLNTEIVHEILSQPNLFKCAFELYHKDKKITRDQFLRIAAICRKAGQQQHHEQQQQSSGIQKVKTLNALLHNGFINVKDKACEDSYSELRELMNDEEFPEVVLGLIDSMFERELQAQQMLTLFEIYQSYLKRRHSVNPRVFKAAQGFSLYPIFDENNAFTPEGRACILQRLQATAPDSQLNALKELILALPKSERIVYAIDNPNESAYFSPGKPIKTDKQRSRLFTQAPQKTLFPSCGLRNAIGVLRYGSANYVPVLPQFNLTAARENNKQIKEHKGPLSYLYYPNAQDSVRVQRTSSDIFLGVFAHSSADSDRVSSIPDYARAGLLRLADLLRAKTRRYWSRDLWVWIDTDFRNFQSKNSMNHNPATHFCFMLDPVENEAGSRRGLLINKHTGITPSGIFILMDMVEHKKIWKNIGINPEQLPREKEKRSLEKEGQAGSYKDYFSRIERIIKQYPEILKKPAETQLMEMLTFLVQKTIPSREEMETYSRFVEKLQRLMLLKIKKDHSNNLCLYFNTHRLNFNVLQQNCDIQLLLLMYHDYRYRSKSNTWTREDFLIKFEENHKIINSQMMLDSSKKNYQPGQLDRAMKSLEPSEIIAMKLAVNRAVNHYLNFSEQLSKDGFFSSATIEEARAPVSKLSKFGHREKGRIRAKTLLTEINALDDTENIKTSINRTLQASETAYHKNSVASFLLDELNKLSLSEWRHLKPKEKSNRYERPPGELPKNRSC